MTTGANVDPTEHNRWRPLRVLLAAMDADIARLYAERGIDPRVKPSYVPELIRLHTRGPMTITALATSIGVTHSAMSQKVAAMRTAGLVKTRTGTDARSKDVSLTAMATDVVALLMAEWQATEAAVAEIDAEIPYPLAQVVADIEKALRRKNFHDRIADRLAHDDAWRNTSQG